MLGSHRIARTLATVGIVAALVSGSSLVWLHERSSFERDVRGARLLDPLPADAGYAAEMLAARVAVRYCDDVAVESHFEVDDYTGGDDTRLYVPSCLPQPERTGETLDMTGVRTYVTAGSIPQMILERRTRCLAVPGGDSRYLIAYSAPGEGYRCPTPGCDCRIPPRPRLK